MVNGIRSAEGQTLEKSFRGDERRREDYRVDVLSIGQRAPSCRQLRGASPN